MEKIIRSEGENDTEKILAKLCDNAFLRLWVYPNVYKNYGKELCDVLVVFENEIYIFSVKDIKFSSDAFKSEDSLNIAWKRWRKTAIDESIKQVNGAERWLKGHPDRIFLDAKCTKYFPINLQDKKYNIHKIIVAHGADDACCQYFQALHGSLPISYLDSSKINIDDCKYKEDEPFRVELDKNDIIHLFDTYTLDIILNELDTITDFSNYISTKEDAIRKTEMITYCGEEDLLGLYLKNYDEKSRKHYIINKKEEGGILFVIEGTWHIFSSSEAYKAKKAVDEISYFWDKLLQRTSQNALNMILGGNADVFNGSSAIIEMAKESRFMRRHLSSIFLKSVAEFPENCGDFIRKVSGGYSEDLDNSYVFLQLKSKDLENLTDEVREKRIKLLEIACGTFKNKFPKAKKIIGICINAPKFSTNTAEDFVLLNCEHWSNEDKLYYQEANEGWNFWQTEDFKISHFKIREYPQIRQSKKVGRNATCPCGSGKKYKKCCMK